MKLQAGGSVTVWTPPRSPSTGSVTCSFEKALTQEQPDGREAQGRVWEGTWSLHSLLSACALLLCESPHIDPLASSPASFLLVSGLGLSVDWAHGKTLAPVPMDAAYLVFCLLWVTPGIARILGGRAPKACPWLYWGSWVSLFNFCLLFCPWESCW